MLFQDSTLRTSPNTLQAVTIILLLLNCLVLALRLYTRHSLRQTLKFDDWFALIGYCFVLALSIYFSLGISDHYIGYPIPPDFTGEVYHPVISGSLQHFWISSLLFFPTLFFAKCTIVLFYRRVLVVDSQDYRDWANILVSFALVLIALWSLGFGLTWTFACNPVKGFWSWPYAADEGPCLDTWALNQGIGISDFLVDVFILLIPVPLVWRLLLPTSKKVAVLIVFFLGGVAVAASVLRMTVILWAISAEGAATADGLLVNTTVLFWGLIESHLCLLAASLPTLRGLLKTRAVGSLVRSYNNFRSLHFTNTSRSRTNSRSKTSAEGRGNSDDMPLTPLTNVVIVGGDKAHGNGRDKYPHDVTLATLDLESGVTERY